MAIGRLRIRCLFLEDSSALRLYWLSVATTTAAVLDRLDWLAPCKHEHSVKRPYGLCGVKDHQDARSYSASAAWLAVNLVLWPANFAASSSCTNTSRAPITNRLHICNALLILTAYANSLFHCHGNGSKGRSPARLIAPKLSEKDFSVPLAVCSAFAPYLVHLRINGRNIALELIKGYTYLGRDCSSINCHVSVPSRAP